MFTAFKVCKRDELKRFWHALDGPTAVPTYIWMCITNASHTRYLGVI